MSYFNFCHSSSFLESRCLILATTYPGTPPSPPSAPELGGIIRHAGLGGNEDTLGHASQADTIVILEPATLPSANDITIASPSQQESDAELTGDPPPLASHRQYEVV